MNSSFQEFRHIVSTRRVARIFVAGLAQDLERRIEDLLKDFSRSGAKDLTTWLKKNFKVGVSVRGHKSLVQELDRFMEILSLATSLEASESFGKTSIETLWNQRLKPHIDELIQFFTDEGGSKLLTEHKIGGNTYLNKAGLAKDTLIKYATRLEALFGTLTGWRKKALAGGVTVALASPKDFRGTSSGKYKEADDTLYVRSVPKVLQRASSSYASVDYILIHELGHRYEKFNSLPTDFDKPEWWTSKYSMTESMSGSSESFAELFAIGHFNLTGPWDQTKVEKFEKLMG